MATLITNDGFWTDVDIDDFNLAHEAPSSYDPVSIKNALIIAMLHSNDDLLSLKKALTALGHSVFANYAKTDTTNFINNEPVLATYYRLAVYSFAKYQLLRLSPALGRSVREEDASEKDNDMSALLLERYSYAIGQLFNRCTSLSALTITDNIPSNISSSVI